MTPFIEMRSIRKVFPGPVIANDGCNLEVASGEIHAIIGENGAGKSTLMNILCGLSQPDDGEILVRTARVSFQSPRAAKSLGIEMVHQHFALVPSFTVMENSVLGYEPRSLVFYDRSQARRDIEAICERFHLEIPLNEKVKDLPVGAQQKVEIMKAIYRKAEVLILDEPTAVLTPQETDELFRICEEMVRNQKTILFISHKLKEVMRISDRVTVMRKGKTIATMNAGDTNENELAKLIIGQDRHLVMAERILTEDTQREDRERRSIAAERVLEIRNLVVQSRAGRTAVNNLDLSVASGEILGIAGVEGNGQTELMEAIAGILPATVGEILLRGRSIRRDTIRTRRGKGIRYVPEDRLRTGLCLDASITENLSIDRGDRAGYMSRAGFIDWKKAGRIAEKTIADYSIAAPGGKTKARHLSGGNMQKVVAARELSARSRCLLVSHPTRGIDIGTADFIYTKIMDAKARGTAILLVSADLEEIFLLSDRIAVLYEGRINGEFLPGAVTPEELGLAMTGAHQGASR
jgi:ABC-type uncharacterized transport system ATPase subunit